MVDEASAREVEPAAAPVALAPIGRRWAVLVGVSKYAAEGLNLRYAHRDAISVHDLIVTPEGGNFAADNIRLLCDGEATTSAVTRAVRGFLMEAMADDLVLLFFACHGGPDPRRPSGPLYLYTYDTDPRDVSGTAFAMDEIDRSLQQLIRARRIVIIADTCHSGGIGGGVGGPGTRAASGAEATNRYLAAMAEAKGGVALLTSAEAAEASLEDRKWGGGHGVFTHFLLEGMRGAADGYGGAAKDGIVSVGELFDYVRDQVQQATDGHQHPAVGTTRYDRRLPMAVTGDLDVEQHLQLGRHLVDVGWILDDPAPMLLAARQFGVAADLKRRLPTADAERGAALLAAGRTDEAADVLRAAVAAAPSELPAEAWLSLGIAEAERGSIAAAATSFREYRTRSQGPADPWVDAYIEFLEQPAGRLRAVLIGAGKFRKGSMVTSLPGTANDVRLLGSVLKTTFGIDDAELEVLSDEQATMTSVRSRLTALRKGIHPNDAVFVYFTGHSIDTAGADEPFLVIAVDRNDTLIGITPRQLVEALDMPAREVLLVLDTHISPAFLDLVDGQANENLTVLLACGVGEVAYEKLIDGNAHGLFTASLAAELTAVGRDTTYETLIESVKTRVQTDPTNPGQTPQLAGSAHGRVFGGRFPHAGLWRARRRWRARDTDIPLLRRAVEAFDQPVDWWAYGRLATLTGDEAAALDRLGKAARGPERAAVLLDVALAQLSTSDRPSVLAALSAVEASLAGVGAEAVQRATALLSAAPALPTMCLVAPMTGAISTEGGKRVADLAAALAASFDRPPNAVEVLAGERATVEGMRGAARRLGGARGMTNLLVFVGSTQIDEGLSYRLADGTLPAAELRATLVDPVSIVGLLQIEHVVERDVALTKDSSTLADFGLDAAVGVTSDDDLTTLVSRLGGVWTGRRTFAEWAEGVPSAVVVAGSSSLTVADGAVWSAVRAELVHARRAVATEAARLAEDAVARRAAHHEEHPEGHLQAGLAYAAAFRWAEALRALRAARNLYDDASINAIERAADPSIDRWHMESRYHYGRLQYEHGDDLYDAVATLQAAVRQAPDDPRLLLHLVRAIRALVDRESLVEARRRARRYLELGAPLGGAEELRRFVAPPTR